MSGFAIVLMAGLVRAAVAAEAPADIPAGVKLRQDAAGAVLTTADDRTLYTYAQDKDGKSACNKACAAAWPPLLAPADAVARGDWTPIAREEQARQWMWRGHPLYSFAKDQPGTEFGEGAGNGAWHAAFAPIYTPPGIIVRTDDLAHVLADREGNTLFWLPDKQDCRDRCLSSWAPVRAPEAASPTGAWTIVSRPDGTHQWAYEGHPLFRRVERDGSEQERAKWTAAVLSPAPPLPAWVQVHETDMGKVYTDAQGLTLYTGPTDLERVKRLLCDDACLAQNWKPVPAAADAKPSGHWSVIADTDGARRWAYRGKPVYLHTRDHAPGDYGGASWGVGLGGDGWQPVMALASPGS